MHHLGVGSTHAPKELAEVVVYAAERLKEMSEHG
jgi:hypothetical protein